MTKGTLSVILGAAIILGLAVLPGQTGAQTVLEMKRVVNVYPDIELYFQVNSAGQLAYINDKSDYTVEDNGANIESFTLWCPDPATRYPISVAMVLDASGSMSGAGNAGAKAAGNAFINMMDSTSDEAAVLWFTSVVNVALQMTNDLNDLHDAVNALPASGATAVWDGIYTGLQEVNASAVNSHRAVIALTDGNDNSSTHTPGDIITYALQNHIRVYTIGLGGVSPRYLDSIATATGGIYYQTPSASELATIFQEISSLASKGFEECMLYYKNECKDGAMHTVQLAVDNPDGGTDMKTRTYRAELDSATIDRLYLSVGDHIVSNGEEYTIPVHYHTPYPVTVGPAEFTVGYGSDMVESATVSSVGTALEQADYTVTPIDGGFTIRINEPVPLQGSGDLIALDVKTVSEVPVSSVSLPIGGWHNQMQQCLYVGTEDGNLVAAATGIGSYAPSLAESIEISPNPNNGHFEVSLDFEQPTTFTIRVVNIFGQEVYTRRVDGSRTSYRESISLDNTVPGVYFFTIQSNNRWDFRKVIIR